MKNKLKQYIKNFFANDYIRTLLAYMLHFYIYFVYKTSKIIMKGDYKNILEYIDKGNGLVLFTWHGRMMLSPLELNRLFKKEIKKGRNIAVLASLHRDGKIASKTILTFKLGIIEGSSINNKKGKSKGNHSLTSVRHIMKSLSNGDICVLAADGPRGPKFKMVTKVIEIVKKTETAIAYASISYKYKKQLNTWDEFQLPYPFNKIIIEYGQLLQPQMNDNSDKLNRQLEEDLNKTMKKNDSEILIY